MVHGNNVDSVQRKEEGKMKGKRKAGSGGVIEKGGKKAEEGWGANFTSTSKCVTM